MADVRTTQLVVEAAASQDDVRATQLIVEAAEVEQLTPSVRVTQLIVEAAEVEPAAGAGGVESWGMIPI
jgi:hypothetical protein